MASGYLLVRQKLTRVSDSHKTEEHGTIWVITEDLRGEGDGPITTVLFPDHY